MTEQESQLRAAVKQLSQDARTAADQRDAAALHRAYLAQIEPVGKIAQLRAHDYDFAGADEHVEYLRKLIAALDPKLGDRDRWGLNARLYHTEAIVFDVKGSFDLFEKMQLVDAPVELEQAEQRYNKTAEILKELGGSETDAAAIHGQALRVKGIRLYGRGRYNIEAADLEEAHAQLADARAALDEASSSLRPLAEAGKLDPQSAMYPDYCLALAAYAQATGHRSDADRNAFAGDAQTAADCLSSQMEQLEHAKQFLLGMTYKVSDSLAHRIAQEIELCGKRKKFFGARAAEVTLAEKAKAERPEKTQSYTRGTLLFVILTLLTFACQIAAFLVAGTAMNIAFYIVALAVSLAVGGIGAGLATWVQGTGFFQGVAQGMKGGKPGKGGKGEKV